MTSTPDQSRPGDGAQQHNPYQQNAGQQNNSQHNAGQHNPYGAGQQPGFDQQQQPPAMNPNTSLMWGHLLNIVSVIGPLVYWLATREQSEAHDREGKEALNWGITVAIASIACSLLYIIPFIGGVIGGTLMGAVGLVNLIFAIYAAVETSNKGGYRYPFTLNLVK